MRAVLSLVRRIIPQPLLSLYHLTLSFAGAVMYGFPSRKLIVVGVTGTKGKSSTVEFLNSILEAAAKEPRWQNIFTTTRDQIVSTDIIGNKHAAIADLSLTHVTAGDLCAIYSWYDNEMGYTNTLVQHVMKLGDTI